MQRGEIWWASLREPFGSEPGFRRPVLIVQDDAFNRSRIQTVIVIAITTNLELAKAPGNVLLPKKVTSLPRESVANVSQLITIDGIVNLTSGKRYNTEPRLDFSRFAHVFPSSFSRRNYQLLCLALLHVSLELPRHRENDAVSRH